MSKRPRDHDIPSDNPPAKLATRFCPFLDTINRHVLDFDFEKLCSVTLTNQNVYVCLVCGKYFQGRGKNTQAYTHALQAVHHIFMNLATGKIYCLPDNYEVVDNSLDDIKYNLRPTFQPQQIATLDKNSTLSQDIFGVSYLPGFVGLNNLKFTDYVNVVVQSFCHVTPLRDFFLDRSNYESSKSVVVRAFGDIICKLWSSRKFKGSVSPHELLQAISLASKKRFKIGTPSEAIKFLSWFLNTLHTGLGGTNKPGSSIIHQCFQGKVKVMTELKDGTTSDTEIGFLFLSLDLPDAPLFKDSKDGNSIIPQIPLFNLLAKFDGETVTDILKVGNVERKRYTISKLPEYLLLHVKRFSKNNWFVEKNPTIVNFPIKNLEMKPYLSNEGGGEATRLPSKEQVDGMSIADLKSLAARLRVDVSTVLEKPTLKQLVMRQIEVEQSSKYDLVANICHELPPDQVKGKKVERLQGGSYRAHVQNKANKQWYEVQDLHVRETMPELIALSESYLMMYGRNAAGNAD